MTFYQLANANQSSLIKAYSFYSELSQRECADSITSTAIQHGFVAPREPIKGATLADWSIRNKAPVWACKSALVNLMKLRWVPNNLNEWAAFGYLFIQVNPIESLEQISDAIPDHLNDFTAAGWICAAMESKTAHLLSKELE